MSHHLIIHNVDETVVAALRRRAARHGHTMEQEAREILTHSVQRSGADKRALVERIRELAPAGAHPAAEALIRAGRGEATP